MRAIHISTEVTTVTERKRSKAEERSYAALLNEIEELKRWEELRLLEKETRDRKLKQEMIPAAWHTVERDVPVRPKKVRVTAAYEEELVKWFRAMGHNYQARMNAVLKAYMLAMKAGRSRAARTSTGRGRRSDVGGRGRPAERDQRPSIVARAPKCAMVVARNPGVGPPVRGTTMRKIGALLAVAWMLAGAWPARCRSWWTIPGSFPRRPRTSRGSRRGRSRGSGPFGFGGFAYEATPGFEASVSDGARCGQANQCLSVDSTFGGIFPVSRFSGFAPGTQSFGVRLLPGSLTSVFAALRRGCERHVDVPPLPPGRRHPGFADQAGLSKVTLGGPGRFDDVVTGIASIPLPPTGLALFAGLGALLALRRRPPEVACCA